MLRIVILASLFLFGFSSLVLPHSGGLNKDGCHNNRKTGEYHCHRSQSASKSKVKQRIISPLLPLLSLTSVNTLPAGTKAVDGDTISFKDKRANVRLVGCDTPESRRGQCDAEKRLAKQAKSYLQKLINTGNVQLEYVPCSCKPGTEGTDACNHSRACGILRADGRNVCDMMIDEGLAVSFLCGATSCPPQQNWCE
jgi:endonuclease YncB( thermonuclease family)